MRRTIGSDCTPFICTNDHVQCVVCQQSVHTAPLYRDRVYKNVDWGEPCANVIDIADAVHLGGCLYAHKTCTKAILPAPVKISKLDIQKHMKTERDRQAWLMRVLKRRHSLLRQHAIIPEHTGASGNYACIYMSFNIK